MRAPPDVILRSFAVTGIRPFDPDSFFAGKKCRTYIAQTEEVGPISPGWGGAGEPAGHHLPPRHPLPSSMREPAALTLPPSSRHSTLLGSFPSEPQKNGDL
eukprot:gnl/Ergobibamus_cyprinoides/661.p4 GENE.gnl/Ergobibamus_cyprinoides/661~~gnl/Ergobibamus_cyprinoides/661.p4  ORF type:complete len:101 (+),score=3.23 gnl/Ergobibamus_cyprinoides/661:597-899(+)